MVMIHAAIGREGKCCDRYVGYCVRVLFCQIILAYRTEAASFMPECFNLPVECSHDQVNGLFAGLWWDNGTAMYRQMSIGETPSKLERSTRLMILLSLETRMGRDVT